MPSDKRPMETDLEGVQYVLLDIEGTISPISFVKETLFPYALKALPDVVAAKWDDEPFKPYRDAFPDEHRSTPKALQAHVEDLTKRDVKVAYLKNLQGYLWEEGYRSGAYATPLFPDVAPKLKAWKDEGVQLAIYSSGSVFAQKLLFEHVKVAGPVPGMKRSADEADGKFTKEGKEIDARHTKTDLAEKSGKADAPNGDAKDTTIHATQTEDLRHLMTEGGWFDTTNAGLKTEGTSYSKIIETLKWPPARTLFLTDNVKELDAAIEAGMKSILLDRPGNAAISEADRSRMDVVGSLEEIHLPVAAKPAASSASVDGAKEVIGGGDPDAVDAIAEASSSHTDSLASVTACSAQQ